MDRRSWPWRRKTSDKISGRETVGSSPEQHQIQLNHNTQCSEPIWNVATSGDGQVLNNTVETLSVKLSDALINIRAKDDLVRKHAKVAEEAVSGWERAENEVVSLKKQNNALAQKTSALEEHIGHLDGALKECLRQLRRAREEQEEKICDAIVRETSKWESTKSEFESQLAELRARLQDTKTEADNALSRVKAAEDENSALKSKLHSKTKELEPMILSTSRDTRNFSRSSISPPVGIDLMDDFLEMERLAALPDGETTSQNEMDALTNIVAELEEDLKKIKFENKNLESALNESRIELKQMEAKAIEMKKELDLANEAKRNSREEAEYMSVELTSIKDSLDEANNAKIKLEKELVDTKSKKEQAEAKIVEMGSELETLRSSITNLEKELEMERYFSKEAIAKGEQLEAEMSRMKLDSHHTRFASFDEDQELAATASQFAECQKTIASLSRQLKSLATYEDFLIDPDRSISVL
ncbi:filament-like plant protein 3 [Andrographis paniculata]|uniref:filament-like plant protein 3 n=1 Tax=Andrographis paniculata TaxID=175694 RepID=UPI0021E8BB81|nr:filament-like plant protein 3 [Andrographis paniculata]